MRVSAPASDLFRRGLRIAAAAVLSAAALGVGAGGAAPVRVVSMNLCTDQLAMRIAAPGQLVSVSHLAADPRLSVLAADAARLNRNHGQAEEIFLLRPDVVLADEWSDPAAIGMLRRLGVRVEQFPPGQSIGEIRGNILRMGDVLGETERAAAVLADFDRAMASVLPRPAEPPRAALYGPNGWTDGPGSLAGQIVEAAGYRNIAADLGYGTGGVLPLEVLVMAAPDLVVTAPRDPADARAEAVLFHPALSSFRDDAAVTDASWVCAGPDTPAAIRRLAEYRLARQGPWAADSP